MQSNSIRLITFDVTRTLLQFRIPPPVRYAEIARNHGIKVHDADLTDKFKTGYEFMSHKYPNFGKGSIGWERWWSNVIKKTFENYTPDKTLIESVASDLIKMYKGGNEWTVSEGAESLLEFLKSTNVKLGVISNFDPRLDSILKHKNLHEHFEFVVTSYDANSMKPNSKIFSQALKASGITDIKKEEAMHIGDDVEKDYNGAKMCGWQAIVVNKKRNLIDNANNKIESDHIFPNLGGILEYFEKNRNILA